ncbi:putative membrane protein [Spinactinospora alkalitolerans]|uniref:Putative membrane protein n=1 Tax=Spinactinospora alkalitolerans TaxID=687207 RepID=A0A852U224_9ACTN|nr:DUF4129 domain-containing protein [Spinactinospora alkalitolerans]NYE49647.1 putative membrane protein [Spinactinospora alkalitolerans]
MSREEGARLAREELSDSVYQEAEPGLVERLYTWFMGWLEELARRVGDSVPGGWWVLGPLLALLVLLVVALVVYTRPARRTGRRGAVVDSGAPLSATDHRALSERHAAEGAYAEAVRERLRAISRDLEERAIIPPRPGRTATELTAEAALALPSRRTALQEGARVFNDVWYGERPATAEGYAVLRDLDAGLREGSGGADAERAG